MAVAVRHGLKRFLGGSGYEGQNHNGQGQGSRKNGVSQSQNISKKHHSKQAEYNRRNAGQGFCGKLNHPHHPTRLCVFIQIYGRANAQGRGDEQGNNYNVQCVYDISQDSKGSLCRA